MLTRFKRTKALMAALVLLCVFVGIVVAADSTPPEQAAPDWRASPALVSKQFTIDDFKLHYNESGTVGKATIVFIHGTPGSWRALGQMLTDQRLQARARLIAIDRPGWGQSQLPDGQRSEADFDAQINLITPLLQQLKAESNDQPLLLVGHSYGGSLAPFIAYRHPELVEGILMAASAISPELGKARWYNKAASTWLVSRFLGDAMLKANDEIWGVSAALEQLRPWWRSATIPMIFVQGEEDSLVDPLNLGFAEEYLPPQYSQVIRLPEQGHLLHRQRRELLTQLSLELLQQTAAPLRN